MFQRFALAAVTAAVLAACGGGSNVTQGTETAACDWTALVDTNASTYRKCQQATGPSAEIEPGRASCASGTATVPAGVVRATCPDTGGAGLQGCCSYPMYGLAMTFCYYDAAHYPTVRSTCESSTVNGDPAVWTTTVPVP
jgi:hypothetical protein